jgi:protein-disulfide isomerase/uncharacterized membrane protein
MRQVSKGVMAAYAALCIAGIGVSAELTRIHVFVHTDPDYHSVCAVSEGVNCETVAASPFSVFAGAPVSVWGMGGYALMGLLALWGLIRRRRLHETWPLGLLLLLTAVSVATSAALAFISLTRIDSLCLFCTASYAINLGLLSLVIVAIRRADLRFIELLALDARALASRPVVTIVIIGAMVSAAIALPRLIPAYWKTPEWLDLPALDTGVNPEGHHWIGSKTPAVTIVEFSDYECPHCRAAHKAIRVLAARYPDEIQLVHRHFPLDMACNPRIPRPFHARACFFAEAAECAGREGRFWEMNDALFSIQDTVKTENVNPVDLAVRLGLNRSEFKQCLERHATAGRIADDLEEAAARKLKGTPSFLIGDRLFLGKVPENEIERLLKRPQPETGNTASREGTPMKERLPK